MRETGNGVDGAKLAETALIRYRNVMQPRFDFPAWEALYREKIGNSEWNVPNPVESPMDVVKRELWLRENPPAAQGVPVDYFLFGLGEPADPTQTKFGGVPYRSKKLKWPKTREKLPCEFIGQINFSASYDLVPELPSDLLLIFVEYEEGEDFHCEWSSTRLADPMDASDMPEQQEVVSEPVYCELHRSLEYAVEEREDDDPLSDYGNMSITKIGGVSDYFGDDPPDLPGKHIFTLAPIWTSKGRPFPFLNRHDPIPNPETPGGHMAKILMFGDLGEAYFYAHKKKVRVASGCF